MRKVLTRLVAVFAFITLMSVRPIEASPIALDGTWTTLIDIMPIGEFFTGKGYGSTTLGGAKSFDWSSPLDVLLKLTDLFVVGDEFRIYDNGVAVGDAKNSGTSWKDIPGCHGNHDTDCHWTDDPDTAWADPFFAKGEIRFAPGDHSVTIQVLNIPSFPGQSGEHNPHRYINSTVALSATELDVVATPEPASLMLLGTGLLGLAARARRRKTAAN